MNEVEVDIYGKVQGVGFRAFAQKQAKELGITGYVQNMPEGHVELVAQGPKEMLEQFTEALKSGPSFARVEDVDLTWHDQPQDTFTDFDIQ